MSGVQCTEASCGKPLPAGLALCYDHSTALDGFLDELPGVLADLGAAAIRATMYGRSLTAANGDPALIVDFEAMDSGRELAALINSWTGMILPPLHQAWVAECEQIDIDAGVQVDPNAVYPKRPGPVDHHSPASCARWLRSQSNTIRKQDWAGDMLEEFQQALWTARRGTDKAPERVFAGFCPTEINEITCGSPLYALIGKRIAKCRTCGNDWDATRWRAEAIAASGMQTGTAVEISRALTDPVTGEALPSATIRQWAKRKKLIHINGPERLYALGSGLPVPAKQYQLRKVRNLWAGMQASKYGNPLHKKTPDRERVAA